MGRPISRSWRNEQATAKDRSVAGSADWAFDPKAFLTVESRGHRISRHRKGAVIFAQEDPADAVFYLQEGKIKIVALSDQGKEAVVGLVGADEFFGEGCLLGQTLRLASARAMVDSEVTRIEKAEMIRLLHTEPALRDLFMTHLLTRSSRIEADLVDQLFNSSEKRLARTLLLLANFGKGGGPQPITISQKTLANIVGTTRPRVSHFMNKFRKLGFIDYGHGGHIKVDSSLLGAVLRE